MEFKREVIVNKSIHEVWEVLGNQFSEAYKWASGLKYSEGFGKPTIAETSCSNRACDTTQGKIKEEILVFDTQNYILQYKVIAGFPFFVDQGINSWQLRQTNNGTKVSMHLTIKLKGLVGTIMSPMMKMQMGSIASNVIEDFKHYVETGEPSPRKAKELIKFAPKAA